MIYIDFETRSTVDLKRSGVYPYAAHRDTDIWCMAWAVDGGEPRLWRAGDPPPAELLARIAAGERLCAWNAQFERLMWDRVAVPRYGFPRVPVEQWECSLARSAACGLAASLGTVAAALGTPQQKDMAGYRLMLQMCKPQAVVDGAPQWWDDEAKVRALGEYCLQDVRAEQTLHHLLPPLPVQERDVYLFDQRINDRGVNVNWELVSGLQVLAERARVDTNKRVAELTGGAVTSITQTAALTEWLKSRGVDVESISAPVLERALLAELPDDVYDLIRLRLETGCSSIAKLQAMLDYRDPTDDRMHGLLQYHGAATGRWAGRGPQPQNLPRVTTREADFVATITEWLLVTPPKPSHMPLWRPWCRPRPILDEAYQKLCLWGPPLRNIAQMLRRCIIARAGAVLYGGDFASVEARMTAFLAGHSDLVDAFRAGRDVYVDMASHIYGVSPDQVTKSMRHIGKIAILGLGYGMGAPKFRATAWKYGIEVSEEESRRAVNTYRNVHYPHVALWKSLQGAAIRAVRDHVLSAARGLYLPVAFSVEGQWLLAHLPSGRCLRYLNPRLVENEYDGVDLMVDSYSSMTKTMEPVKLYGGLLTENVVQALCRDLLVHSMWSVERQGFPVILTIHDEILSEAPPSKDGVEEFKRAMSAVPEWAAGFPLVVEAWSAKSYEK